MRDALSRKSVVPVSSETNREGLSAPPGDYAAGALQMGWRVNSSPEDRKAIDERFQNTKDKDGRSMAEVAKEYWERKRRGR